MNTIELINGAATTASFAAWLIAAARDSKPIQGD